MWSAVCPKTIVKTFQKPAVKTIVKTVAKTNLKTNVKTFLSLIVFCRSTGIDVNQTTFHGDAPLTLAIGDEVIVQRLLEIEHIDVNKIEDDGDTPLTKAVDSKNAEAIRILLKQPGIKVVNHFCVENTLVFGNEILISQFLQ